MSDSWNIITFDPAIGYGRRVMAAIGDPPIGSHVAASEGSNEETLLALAGAMARVHWVCSKHAFHQDHDWKVRRRLMLEGKAVLRWSPLESKWVAGWYRVEEHFYGEGAKAHEALAVLALRAMERPS